jgi:hypothetical protein
MDEPSPTPDRSAWLHEKMTMTDGLSDPEIHLVEGIVGMCLEAMYMAFQAEIRAGSADPAVMMLVSDIHAADRKAEVDVRGLDLARSGPMTPAGPQSPDLIAEARAIRQPGRFPAILAAPGGAYAIFNLPADPTDPAT